MKSKFIIFLGFSLFLMNCKTHIPFSSKKDKNNSIHSINKYINLSKNEFNFVNKVDSLLYEVSLSVKNKVKPKLIERRLDSFFTKKYSEKELLLILRIDREIPSKIPMEFIRDSSKIIAIDVINVEELKKALKDMDANMKIINKKDTIK